MTENEAIKRIEEFGMYHAIGDLPHSMLTVKAFKMAIEALQKIQQYREIGTVDECRKAIGNWREKKPIVCLHKYSNGRKEVLYRCLCGAEIKCFNGFCSDCGQSFNWSDN